MPIRISIILSILLFNFTGLSQETGIIRQFTSEPEKTLNYFSDPILKNESEIRNWISDVKILSKELAKDKYDKNDLALQTHEMLNVFNFMFESQGYWRFSGIKFYIKWPPELGVKVLSELEKSMMGSYYEVIKRFKKLPYIKIPEGVIFVWIFSSRDRFSESLNLSQEIGGITYMSRFILLPLEYYRLYDFPIADFKNFERTFSHELAHSVFNSIIGTGRAARLPKWFKEGVAIHFGGDRKYSFRGQTRRELSREYREYYDLFKYLKEDFGESELNELINRTINGTDPDQAFTEIFGYNSAEKYLAYKNRILYLKFGIVVVLLIIFVFLIYRLLQRFNIEISLTLYFFWIGLIILGFIVYSSVIIVSFKSRILLLINGILLFFIVVNDIIFNIKFSKFSHKVSRTDNYPVLENTVFEILEFFKYKSRRKKKKISALIRTSLEKLIEYYKVKNLLGDAEEFYKKIEETIKDSYDLRTSEEMEELLEQYEQKIEFLKKTEG